MIYREADQEELIISREKKETNRSSSYRLTLPSDGYEWKKYGQKFIKNIGKFRYVHITFFDQIRIEMYYFNLQELAITWIMHSYAMDRAPTSQLK